MIFEFIVLFLKALHNFWRHEGGSFESLLQGLFPLSEAGVPPEGGVAFEDPWFWDLIHLLLVLFFFLFLHVHQPPTVTGHVLWWEFTLLALPVLILVELVVDVVVPGFQVVLLTVRSLIVAVVS